MDSAIECFWRNGLKASSIRTLAEEMGIAGPSLYNAYGNKQTLFAKALVRYADTTLRPRFLRVRDLPPLEAIRFFLFEQIEITLNDPDGKGCLFVNTTVETANGEQELSNEAIGYLNEIKDFFASNLRAAQSNGNLSPDVSVVEMSETLFVMIVGVCVYARMRPSRSELEAALAPAFKLLTAQS
ncbi:MAG: TetR/AcrR family transcriptional regulator [Hyphomicrobiales bacterium]|nr:TetR/AcrR family transcriptional regulator [Hyphomicrobiales bacterium]